MRGYVMHRLLPAAASAHAADLDAVLTLVHVYMAIQAIAWGAFFLYCVFRFRARASTSGTGGTGGTLGYLAIALVVVGDALLLATTALPAWFARTTPPDPSTMPLEVHVVAEQFAWHVHYPGPDRQFGPTSPALISASNPLGIDRRAEAARDDIGLTNVLTVPVDRPVIVLLSSRDVVHSFTLNEMRVRQDATPGMLARTWFTPVMIGKWEIACSQLCGLGHYRMRGSFSVVDAAGWAAWQAREVSLIQMP
jgi:cytochrome c oxidase subunit 2